MVQIGASKVFHRFGAFGGVLIPAEVQTVRNTDEKARSQELEARS
jgi:hypothetical protein